MVRFVRSTLFAIASPLVRMWGRTWMQLFGCTVARSASIFGRPYLWHHHGTLTIGERTHICSIPAIYEFGQEFDRCTFATGPGSRIDIGADCSIAGSAFFARQQITIGDRVMIAAGCRIADHDSHPVDQVPRRYLIDEDPAPVIIEDDVWLCAEVMVCRGVHIGHGSVIGAKSLVTRDIPPMVLAAGIPTQVIRPLRVGENARPVATEKSLAGAVR